ncbi:hypothetical protein FB567DRAFT_517479 [Paraphoma chrysanthemicola]|uniref:Uncharacterized protein n=1 Tax=Paraphoma chrysanthemicola TaxID=798071 RepID=A0A8K0RGG0_9PLEO|nr:hypothetical protein FB567DRAFT_517479 [Paraphoma chrysanthemicola]
MTTPSFPFLSLPLELREAIYSLYFKPADRLLRSSQLEEQGFYGGVYKFDVDLFRLNKQVYHEAKRVWKRENVFVKIATPWPSAVHHISSEGLVPLVCASKTSEAFTSHHALVQITAPFHNQHPEFTIVILLDDLHLFTQTWYYSALSYPMLNDRLSTSFILRDPDAPAPSNTSSAVNPATTIPLALQKKLLLPFEQVKGLYHKDIINYAPSVRQELEQRMAIPVPSLQSCCEAAVTYMEQGDAVLATDPAAALQIYFQAFHAIHIIIFGRTRRVLADVFFHAVISSGRFAGQTGMTVRVILRLKLVARCIKAYLGLREWGEAAFWGMRTIRIMRESMDTDFEDFLTEFVGGEDVGLIYVRTGVAIWSMEREVSGWDGKTGTQQEEAANKWKEELKHYADDPDLNSSERVFSTSARYLKGRRKADIRKELEAFQVPKRILDLYKDEETEDRSTVAVDGSGEE